MDDPDDGQIAELLALDGLHSFIKYSAIGVGAFGGAQKRPADRPKPNTQFLRRQLAEKSQHNSNLASKERAVSTAKLLGLNADPNEAETPEQEAVPSPRRPGPSTPMSHGDLPYRSRHRADPVLSSSRDCRNGTPLERADNDNRRDRQARRRSRSPAHRRSRSPRRGRSRSRSPPRGRSCSRSPSRGRPIHRTPPPPSARDLRRERDCGERRSHRRERRSDRGERRPDRGERRPDRRERRPDRARQRDEHNRQRDLHDLQRAERFPDRERQLREFYGEREHLFAEDPYLVRGRPRGDLSQESPTSDARESESDPDTDMDDYTPALPPRGRGAVLPSSSFLLRE